METRSQDFNNFLFFSYVPNNELIWW